MLSGGRRRSSDIDGPLGGGDLGVVGKVYPNFVIP